MIDASHIIAGDRQALAKAITLLESSRDDHREKAETLIQQLAPHSGRSIRIGLTGSPGVGKSTLIDTLGSHVISLGHKVAVLAIDPSSSINGGSILGDKTRMPALAINPNAFIRPSPAGASLGGVAQRTAEAIIVCEAAGYDVIIVETVGVGQSETRVSEMTDMFLLMLLPGAGDELQAIKRGIMELADIVVVNKADGDMQARARLSAADVRQALGLLTPRFSDWSVAVLLSSCLNKGAGVDIIWQNVLELNRLIEKNGEKMNNRSVQSETRMVAEIRHLIFMELLSKDEHQEEFSAMCEQVKSGNLLPSVAAKNWVTRFLNK